jgi:hypothetical protein
MTPDPLRVAGASSPEVSLFIVWAKARQHDATVLNALRSRFRIAAQFEVSWSPELVAQNFSRFYRGRAWPPYRTSLQEAKGGGPFLAIIVIDPLPVYEDRETAGGWRHLNANTFDTKTQIRDETGGGFTIHAADARDMAARELTLLFGRNPETWLELPETGGDVVFWPHDPIASRGWADLEEMYEALGWAASYVDIDGAPGRFGLQHIRLLTNEFKEVMSILGAKPGTAFLPKWSGSFNVDVGDRVIPLELRRTTDGYFDSSWAQSLIDRRVLGLNGVYEPQGSDLLEIHLYDRFAHSSEFSESDLEWLRELALQMGAGVPPWLLTEEVAWTHLEAVMKANGYAFVRPADKNVVFNHAAAGSSRPGVRIVANTISRWWYRIVGTVVLAPARSFGLGIREQMFLRFPRLRSLEEAVRGRGAV